MNLKKKWFKEHDINLAIFEGSQLIEHPKVHFLFAKFYHEFLQNDTYSKVTVELLLLQVCDAMSDLKDRGYTQNIPRWVENLKELIHFDKSDLNLKQLSKQLGVHPVHISRAVPKYLSVSLGEYIRLQKLKKAIPLLLNTDNSLTTVAHETGFSDQSHFNRVFNSVFEMSPSAYRKKLNKNESC